MALDETHDPKRTSWVASAQAHGEFPLQNLPLGVFSIDGDTPRGGMAIGDSILELKAALAAGLFTGEAERAASAASGATLNPLLALGAAARLALRRRVFALLSAGDPAAGAAQKLAGNIFMKPASTTKSGLKWSMFSFRTLAQASVLANALGLTTKVGTPNRSA